jgi:hypothetical protein
MDRMLARMAGQARAALGTEILNAIADRGYYNGEQILVREPETMRLRRQSVEHPFGTLSMLLRETLNFNATLRRRPIDPGLSLG